MSSKRDIDLMFKLFGLFRTLSLSSKFTLSFATIAMLILLVMMAIVVPLLEKERLENENSTIERLLTNMEHQVQLTMYVNGLYNVSYWEKMELTMKNKLHSLIDEYQSKPHNEKMLKSLLERHFKDFTCNALIRKNGTIIYATKDLLPDISFFQMPSTPLHEKWLIHDKTKHINICPSGDKEYLYIKPIPQSQYDVAIFCHTQEFLKHRTEFEATIGSMLKKSFQNFKEHRMGFAYMMWVDDTQKICDHNESLRKSHNEIAKNYNTTCCVSEASPTQQPLTGTLKGTDYLKAAQEAKPIRHFLTKKEDTSGKLYPVLTWVRHFKGNREYPLILAISLYEEEIYRDLKPIILKFLPASLIALGCAFGMGWLFFRRSTSKIERLLSVAKTIKSGQLKARSHIKGDDDISLLAQTFDTMLDSLEENIQTLDAKVHKRTHELEHLLSEKEVLLKEIHHRVKNNLSIIIALMQLKEHQAKSDESHAILIELQERIYAIELLHRQLYQSNSLKEISLDTYMQGLVENMRQTYATDEANIVLHVKIEPGFLSIEQALSCGLLVNECVTNAIKHAFDMRGGEIYIAFTCKENQCILEVKDTGKGLSKAFSWELQTSTLGMQLIQGIVRNQLQGEISCTGDQGTHFRFTFLKE